MDTTRNQNESLALMSCFNRNHAKARSSCVSMAPTLQRSHTADNAGKVLAAAIRVNFLSILYLLSAVGAPAQGALTGSILPSQEVDSRPTAELIFHTKADAKRAVVKCTSDYNFRRLLGGNYSIRSVVEPIEDDYKCLVAAYHYLNNYQWEGRSLAGLADTQANAGEYSEAKATMQRALQLAQGHHDDRNAEGAQVAIKDYSIVVGTPEQAIETLKELISDPAARDMNMSPLLHMQLAAQFARRGEIDHCTQENDLAEAWLRTKPKDDVERHYRSDVVQIVAGTYGNCGQADKALNLLNGEIAKRNLQEGRSPAGSVDNETCGYIFQVSLIEFKQGERERARNTYTPCLTVTSFDVNPRQYAGLMTLYQDSDPAFAILVGKYAVNLIQGIRTNLSTASQAARVNYGSWNTDIYRELASILISNRRFGEAINVLNLLKEKEYNEFIQRGAAPTDGQLSLTSVDINQVVKLDQERSALAAKTPLTPEDQARIGYIDKLFAVLKLTTAELFDQTGHLHLPQDNSIRSQTDVVNEAKAVGLRDNLAHNEVAIYTVVGESRYDAILVTDNSVVPWHYDISRAQLRSKLIKLYTELSREEGNPKDLATELYGIIVGKLDKELKASGATNIMWTLDDVLRYIPVAALYDGNQYLVQRFNSVVYNKLSDRLQESRDNWKALGVGVSRGTKGSKSDPLDKVPDELKAIVRDENDSKSLGIFPGKILLNPSFTAEAFRGELHKKYSVVHIATDFVFNPAGEGASFLLLGDGKLSLAELRANSAYTFDGVKLLTLSACETAAVPTGNGSEIDGLGFLAENKGAHAVLASLWQVDDSSTKSLMVQFYSQLISDPKITKSGALQRAQLSMLNKTLTTDDGTDLTKPYFWAPFILLGNPD
jgi:CHAT domain-containing protein